IIGNATAGNLTVNASTFTDPLRLITAGNLALNGALDTGANRLALIVDGSASQSAAIRAGSLRLGGNGNFTLTNSNNAVATLAKDGSGSLAFTQAGALTIGTVDGVSGLFASSVDLRLSSGDLTLAQPVIATGTGNAVVLSTPAAFLNNAGANGVQASAGRWLIYSASPADNTFGGLVSGQAALWDRTIATQAPGSVSPSGNRYLFALSPE